MKQPDNWNTPPEPGFQRGEQDSLPPMMPPQGFGQGYYSGSYRPKKKWLAALFAIFFPGTGHMYLGLMSKGIYIMLMLALNICGIVYFAIENEYDSNVLIIVLLSLMVPILYFYNLFSVMQCTDMVNEQRAGGYRSFGPFGSAGPMGTNGTAGPTGPTGPQPWQDHSYNQRGKEVQQVPVAGIVLLVIAGFILFQSSRSDWSDRLPHSIGSVAGAVILIGLGALVWFWDRRGHSQKKD